MRKPTTLARFAVRWLGGDGAICAVVASAIAAGMIGSEILILIWGA